MPILPLQPRPWWRRSLTSSGVLQVMPVMPTCQPLLYFTIFPFRSVRPWLSAMLRIVRTLIRRLVTYFITILLFQIKNQLGWIEYQPADAGDCQRCSWAGGSDVDPLSGVPISIYVLDGELLSDELELHPVDILAMGIFLELGAFEVIPVECGVMSICPHCVFNTGRGYLTNLCRCNLLDVNDSCHSYILLKIEVSGLTTHLYSFAFFRFSCKSARTAGM